MFRGVTGANVLACVFVFAAACYSSSEPPGFGSGARPPGRESGEAATSDPPPMVEPSPSVDPFFGEDVDDGQCKAAGVVVDEVDGEPMPCPQGEEAIFEGDVFAATQPEVDALVGYVEIRGSLSIGDVGFIDVRPLVDSLAALSCLREIGGDLRIGRTILRDLRGLDSLTAVGGYLNIGQNDRLASLHGLESLRTTPDGITLHALPQLGDLSGLEGLRDVGDFIYVRENRCLRNLHGLEGLTEVRGLNLSGNPSLVDLAGLDNLSSVAGALYIFGNRKLPKCEAVDLAERLGTECSEQEHQGSQVMCTGICTCTGNDNSGGDCRNILID